MLQVRDGFVVNVYVGMHELMVTVVSTAPVGVSGQFANSSVRFGQNT